MPMLLTHVPTPAISSSNHDGVNDQWKRRPTQRIGDSLQYINQDSKDSQKARLMKGVVSQDTQERMYIEYKQAMKNIKRLAKEQHPFELIKEMKRRWVAGPQVLPGWNLPTPPLPEEQQKIMNSLKQRYQTEEQKKEAERFAASRGLVGNVQWEETRKREVERWRKEGVRRRADDARMKAETLNLEESKAEEAKQKEMDVQIKEEATGLKEERLQEGEVRNKLLKEQAEKFANYLRTLEEETQKKAQRWEADARKNIASLDLRMLGDQARQAQLRRIPEEEIKCIRAEERKPQDRIGAEGAWTPSPFTPSPEAYVSASNANHTSAYTPNFFTSASAAILPAMYRPPPQYTGCHRDGDASNWGTSNSAWSTPTNPITAPSRFIASPSPFIPTSFNEQEIFCREQKKIDAEIQMWSARKPPSREESVYVRNGSSPSIITPYSASPAIIVTPNGPLNPQRVGRRSQPVDFSYGVDQEDKVESLALNANQAVQFPSQSSQLGNASWILVSHKPHGPQRPVNAQFVVRMADLRRQNDGTSTTNSSPPISFLLGSHASITSGIFSESSSIASPPPDVEFPPTPVFTDVIPKGLKQNATLRSFDTIYEVAGVSSSTTPPNPNSEAGQQCPMKCPPPINSVQHGYWNHRGDHPIPDSYTTFPPLTMQYPGELRTYPSENQGYQDHTGPFIAYGRRPELPQSLANRRNVPMNRYVV